MTPTQEVRRALGFIEIESQSAAAWDGDEVVGLS